MASWNIFRKSAISDPAETEVNKAPVFDKKYKIIIKHAYGSDVDWDIPYDEEMINWLNNNSIGSIDLKFSENSRHYYIGFEDPDDALFFKIKYST